MTFSLSDSHPRETRSSKSSSFPRVLPKTSLKTTYSFRPHFVRFETPEVHPSLDSTQLSWKQSPNGPPLEQDLSRDSRGILTGNESENESESESSRGSASTFDRPVALQLQRFRNSCDNIVPRVAGITRRCSRARRR